MMRVPQPHPVQYKAPVDPEHYLEQFQRSLTLMARAIVQLDNRLTRLESQMDHRIQPKEDNSCRLKGESWRRRRLRPKPGSE